MIPEDASDDYTYNFIDDDYPPSTPPQEDYSPRPLHLFLLIALTASINAFLLLLCPTLCPSKSPCKNNRHLTVPPTIMKRPTTKLLLLAVLATTFTLGVMNIYTGSMYTTRSSVPKEKKLAFIMTTTLRPEQTGILMKIAQSLYPVRDRVLWVIVSLTEEEDTVLDTSEPHPLRLTPSSSIPFDDRFTRKRHHSQLLEDTLTRFGVPFVLLHKPDLQMGEEQVEKEWQGVTTGVLWALKNLGEGTVFMVGKEAWTYNHVVFGEVLTTEVASIWPVGLGPLAGFSAPIIKHGRNFTGYHSGRDGRLTKNPKVATLLREGVAAVVVRKHSPRTIQAIITGEESDRRHPISPMDVQVLGGGGNEIHVWRTKSHGDFYPTTLNYEKNHVNSNMVKIWQRVFGVMCDQIPVNEDYVQKKYDELL